MDATQNFQYTFENVPEELRLRKIWVTWRLEDTTDESGRERKKCKSPKQASNPSLGAKSNDPSTWSTFPEALAALPKLQPHPAYTESNQRGVGCMNNGEFIQVDLDGCWNDKEQELSEFAEDFLFTFPPTYTELSPSRTGLHLFYWLPEGADASDFKSIKHKKIEIYFGDSGRYLTVTGWRSKSRPAAITRLTPEELQKMIAFATRVRSESKASTTNSVPSAKLEELMTSIAFADKSAAVQSLTTELAYKHGDDADKIDAEFRQSALFKNTHWNKKWERLGKDGIAKAIEWVKKHPRSDEGTSELIVIRGDEVEPEHLEFLWPPYFPIGKLAHLGGAQSQAKSPVTIDLAARTSRGLAWPDDKPNTLGSRSVILLNVEDDLQDTILPRFILAGGDRSKLLYIKGTRFTKKDKSADVMLALDRDITLLCELARRTPDLGLIVIDPISNYLGRVKMNAEEQVRTILAPLASLAAELGIVIITVGHLNRREKGTSPLDRMMGAAAFTGVARVVYLFGPNPDSDSPYSHVISAARGALADDSLIFHTEVTNEEWGGKKSDVIKVVWDGKSKATAEDAADPESRKQKSIEKDLAADLAAFLKDGKPRSPEECTRYLCGIHSLKENDKVNWPRVRRLAKVKHERLKGNNKHVWQVDSGQSVFGPSLDEKEN